MLGAIIACGGKATRLKTEEYFDNKPKCLIKFEGKPLIQWQIEELKKYGINEFIVTVCNKKEQIKKFLNSLNENITIIEEDTPLGNFGSVLKYANLINEKYLFLNGDLMLKFDESLFTKINSINCENITAITHPNNHCYDSFRINNKKEEYEFYNNVSSGLYIINSKFIRSIKDKYDFVNIDEIIKDFGCFDYVRDVKSFIYDIGRPERVFWLRNNIHIMHNYKKRILFVDRDGTIIVQKDGEYVTNKNQVELLENIIDVLKYANDNGIMVVMVTNQPAISMNKLSYNSLYSIHRELERKLSEKNVYLDDILFCPHYPESGFKDEIKELKIKCNCRKPNIGMLLEGCERYNINITDCAMLGDTQTDLQTAKNANIEYFTIYSKKLLNEVKDYFTTKTELENIVDIIYDRISKGGKILICGNGGSASDADHIVGELMKNFLFDRKIKNEENDDFESKLNYGIKAINLSAQTALITAIANDIGYDYIYAQQVYVYGNENDVLICLSTSGNSKNIINAIKAADIKNVITISITGKNKSLIDSYSDFVIKLEGNNSAEIQNETVKIYHEICRLIEEKIWG